MEQLPKRGATAKTYYATFSRHSFFADDASHRQIMPWCVLLIEVDGARRRSRIVRSDFWIYMTPFADEDVRSLVPVFAPASTLVCIPSFQPQLERVLAGIVTVVPLAYDDFPVEAKETTEGMRDTVRSGGEEACYSCTGAHGGVARMAIPAGTGCVGCTAMLESVPGITEAFVRSLLTTCQKFWRARPVRTAIPLPHHCTT